MSREIVEKVADSIVGHIATALIMLKADDSLVEAVRRAKFPVTVEIKCLLADEREPMECGHPKACWTDEGDCLIKVEEGGPPLHSVSMRRPRKYCSACAEREKVRKQCAEHLDKVAELCGTARYEGLLRLRYEAAAREIYQLDLTKDLAASSGEEKKG